jgi:transcriptional regulator with XRE-family HTH domain
MPIDYSKYVSTEVAKRIRILRKINEMSQEELAKKLGISQSMLSKYEKGKAGLTLEIAIKYAEVFKKDLNYIAFGEE